jgi:multicomponent Na+:H+ antiporter subunit G
MISLVLDVFGGVLLMVGLLFLTISIVGVLRLRDTLSQLHAKAWRRVLA